MPIPSKSYRECSTRAPSLFSKEDESTLISPIISFGKLARVPELLQFSLLSKLEPPAPLRPKLLNELVERFLLGGVISPGELGQLPRGEFLILDCLMRRKLKIGAESYVRDAASVDYGLLKVKRLEENYKMVFKSALKHMGAVFKCKKKGKKARAEDTSFYEHYFGETARTRGIPIEAFFHPNKKLKGNGPKKGVPNQKTMNSKYLENLLSSQLFREDLKAFLEKLFVENYNDRRRKKIDNLIDKLRKKFLESATPSYEDLKNYLEKNSKCKLPWSNYEL